MSCFCCFDEPTPYVDLADEKFSVKHTEQDTLLNPSKCKHNWVPYKKKFMICRKCDTKRESLPHEKSQRDTLVKKGSMRQSTYNNF
eukprot:gene1549-12675_t